MKFTKVKELTYDVIRFNKVVIPAGTENVKIAYRSAPWTYVNDKGKTVHGNLYMVGHKIY